MRPSVKPDTFLGQIAALGVSAGAQADEGDCVRAISEEPLFAQLARAREDAAFHANQVDALHQVARDASQRAANNAVDAGYSQQEIIKLSARLEAVRGIIKRFCSRHHIGFGRATEEQFFDGIEELFNEALNGFSRTVDLLDRMCNPANWTDSGRQFIGAADINPRDALTELYQSLIRRENHSSNTTSQSEQRG